MSDPTRLNLTIRRGRTFNAFFRLESEPLLSVGIASMSKAASCRVITDAPHGLVDGWRVAILGAQGLTDLNAKPPISKDKDYRRARVIDANTLEFNGFNTSQSSPHVAGTGFVQWFTPMSLATLVFRLAIKDRVGGTLRMPILSSTGGSPAIFVSDSLKYIRARLEAPVTEPLDWLDGVYDMEAEDTNDGTVFECFYGDVAVLQEITTPS